MRIGPVIELFLDRVFEDLALFFNNQNLLKPVGKRVGALRFKWPHATDLVQTNADARAGFVVETQIAQSLTYIQIRLARRHDPEARIRRFDLDPIQLVRAHISERRVPLVVEQPRFLNQRWIGPADVEAAIGHREIGRQDNLRAMRIDIDRSRRFHHVGHAFHRDPEAGVTAHCPAVQAEVQILLHIRWKQHRQAARLENVFGLVRERGGFGGVVVTCEHEYTAMRGGARRIAVLEHITGSVDARPFAVPHREHAVIFGAGIQIDLLRAPHGGGREVFIHAGLEHDLVRSEMFFRFPQMLIERTERGTAIAGNETGGVESRGMIALLLQHRQPNQRLYAAHVRATAFQGVFVVEGDGI